MHIAKVHIRVKPEGIEALELASSESAAASIKEAGIKQFDILQSQEDPTAFILFEVYVSTDAQSAHK